jgi:hypothetical protein
LLVRAWASTSIASQAVCQSTPTHVWRRDGGVVIAECADCPRHRPGCQHHPGRRHLVGLAESRRRTQRFSAPPDPYQPSHQRDPGEARRVGQDPDPPAVTDRHYSTCRTCGLQLPRLDSQHQPLLTIDLHLEDVHVGNIEDRISSGAPARTGAWQ